MVVVRLIGGLGNQMFQYAYARKLREDGYEVSLDISNYGKKRGHNHSGYLLNLLNISLPAKSFDDPVKPKKLINKLKKMLGKSDLQYLKVGDQIFSNYKEENLDKKYIFGYFQSEKFFSGIKDIIRSELKLKSWASSHSADYCSQIESSECSVSLHVRRGDYMTGGNENIYHSCSKNYYNSAIALIQEKYPDAKFFIFSDDLDWVKSNLNLPGNTVFVEGNTGRAAIDDLFLMSKCNHHITANSTFSWWGAWLNDKSDKITIMPKSWTKLAELNNPDIFSENCIILENV